ncbi:tetratricopeptide TPR_2 repeat protein [Nitrospirillum viridazoti Y2]|nr:tetratricopeptide TPR_2 repeat protein [Nitrospirillum amazonense Y2]
MASLGEEARVRLAQAGLSLATTAETDDDTVAGSLPATLRLEATGPLNVPALAQAVALYAQQAAHDSYQGVASLNIIANHLLDSDDLLDATVTDPLLQQLLAVHVLAFEDDRRRLHVLHTANDPAPYTPHLIWLSSALHIAHIGEPDGPVPAAADRLAALAYRRGDYEAAGRLAAMKPGPLASWVQAKLALQKGDLAQAAKFYAEAAAAFPATGDGPQGSALSAAERSRLAGEGGTVALARGEYVAALDQLMPMADTYWGDVVHIAERVLTVDELKAYVDAKVPASVVAGWTQTVDNKQWPNTLLDTLGVGYKYDEEADRLRYQGAPLALRSLLARRLMRAGRGKEALAYYHNPAVAKDARAYLDARDDAGSAWWAASRARAWFQAAQLARTKGMEIMGTEGVPDEAALQGAYDVGIGQAMLPPAGAAYVTDGERKRFADSAPQPDQRFHYRFIATDAAEHAADQLPHTSQAYAATLCWAVTYAQDQRIATWTDDPATIEDPYWQSVVRRIIERDKQAQGRVAALYQRYLKTGPYQPWAAHFGHACPAPDFDAAAKEWWRAPARQAHRWIARNHRKAVIGGAAALAVLVAGTALLLVRRRRPPVS